MIERLNEWGYALSQTIRKRIEELLASNPVDVLHAHSPVLCGLPALMAARKHRVPMVYEIRAFWEDAAVNMGRGNEDSFKYGVVRSAETALVRAADAVVVICEGLRKDLLDRGIAEADAGMVTDGEDFFRDLENRDVTKTKDGRKTA